MMIITVSEKGQLVIPAQLRRSLGISAGTRLDIIPEANGFKVLVDHARKTKRAADCIGITAYSGAPVSIEEMNVAQYAVK
ncbi:MAG: AbrB/MazE/SpoVT family DNA-binding domain-containing protein [Methylotenera sp.]|nr:AbrB/MazE/SpoVT family DNA-binding domain-containing protein [Methylotenera sp.]NOU41874.1 AbrB/MazE/SpoVT family DNA-binding domain-containing protein [Methylotenera sp.]